MTTATMTKTEAADAATPKKTIKMYYVLLRQPDDELAMMDDHEGEGVPDALRTLGNNLRDDFEEGAAYTEKLLDGGWSVTIDDDAVEYTHPHVTTIAEAHRRLAELGLHHGAFTVWEVPVDETA